jgi:Protein of unknown function (DUF3568)
MDKLRQNSMGRFAGSLIIAALAFLQGGCLLVAAGAAGGAAAGYAYYKGKICESYLANFEDAWAATHSALAELGMPILHEERHADNGVIKTQTSDGDRVRIALDVIPSRIPADGPSTRICVRVGTFGDHPVSERVLYQVGVHLVPAPPARPGPVLTPTTMPLSNQTSEPPLTGTSPVPATSPLSPPEPIQRP